VALAAPRDARQRHLNLSGIYAVRASQTNSNCSNPADNGTFPFTGAMTNSTGGLFADR
jgi:hypothetical protein